MDTVKPYAALEGDGGIDMVDGVDMVDITPLTGQETQDMEQMELIIEQNIAGFFRVGLALKVIREKRLYRMTYNTFEEYCREKWDMGRNYANKKIAAAEIVEKLSSVNENDFLGTTGTQNDFGYNCTQKYLPMNERQLRPLLKLSADDQLSAWRIALDEAAQKNNGKVTARLVELAVEKVAGNAPEDNTMLPICSEYLKKQGRSFIDLIDVELKNQTSNIAGVKEVLNRLKSYLRGKEKVLI